MLEEMKRKSMRMTADALPDDVILEILARVPDAPALFRCAATCRRWRALVADPSFLRRRWPDPAYSLLGSFAPKKLSRPGPDGARLLGSLVPGAAGLPADLAWPLASRDGLVLLRLFNRVPDRTVPLAVCSLLAGTCHVLPPFEWCMHSVGQAVLPTTGSSFKVLMIVAGETHYELHTLDGSWSAPTRCRSKAALGLAMHSDAVVCQGAAHWLFRDASSTFRVLRVDAGASSTKLTGPVGPGASNLRGERNVQRDRCRLATTADGKLLSLCLYDAGRQQVEIWTQPAAGRGGGWPRTGVIDLKPILGYIWLRGRCGKLIIMLAQQGRGFLANLEAGTMQELDDISSSDHLSKDDVYVEIDWTAFFMARLLLHGSCV